MVKGKEMLKIKIPNINKLLVLVGAFLIVYMTGSIKVSLESTSGFARFLSVAIILVFSYPLLEVLREKKFGKLMFLCIVILACYWVFNYLHYAGSINNLLFRFLWIIVFFAANIWLVERKHIDINYYIYNVILILSYIAIFFWIIVYIFKINLPFQYISNGSYLYKNYYDLFFTCSTYAVDFGSLQIHRLQSIFWEPGVYGVLLNYALLYFTFSLKAKRKSSFIVLIICTVLTFSTTSIIVAIFLIGYYILNDEKLKKTKALLAIPISVAVLYSASLVWIDKRTTSYGERMSYGLRMSDLQLGFKLFINNFLVGIGYNNIEVFKTLQGYGRGNSNGLITLAYSMGIVGLILFLYPFFKNLFRNRGKSNNKEIIRQIIYIITFVAINMTEPIYMTPLILWMVSEEYVKCYKG